MNPQDKPAERPRRFIRFGELKPLYGIGWSRMHCDRMSKRGEFPEKVRLSRNTVGYFSDQIESWLAARAAAPATPLPNDLPKARAALAAKRAKPVVIEDDPHPKRKRRAADIERDRTKGSAAP